MVSLAMTPKFGSWLTLGESSEPAVFLLQTKGVQYCPMLQGWETAPGTSAESGYCLSLWIVTPISKRATFSGLPKKNGHHDHNHTTAYCID